MTRLEALRALLAYDQMGPWWARWWQRLWRWRTV